jgi:hypothetical protein
MIVYEFYWRDEEGREHLIGILPERRKDPERISEESILNWGKVIATHNIDINKIYFIPVEI